MRRTLVAAVVAVATALTVGPGPLAAADDAFDAPVVEPAPAASGASAEQQADEALATVSRLLSGPGAQRAGAVQTSDLTLAMRDLYVALPRLDADERDQALDLMARPTDGANDRNGDGYAVPSTARCGGNFCVHYVTSTADAPPSESWVGYTLKQMNKVWKTEVKRLGYRKPLSDAPLGPGNGGNAKFDIYLKDLGSRALYGYCVPEAGLRGSKYKFRAISYCVLDNDFATAQFGTAPKPTLQVTAAHEFFHAVQFSYDYGEDRWFMESTATWAEERFADGVNDNRQYLPASQVAAPWAPLDTFAGSEGSNQYGNWVFWEYLSQRFGQSFVRKVWESTAPHGKRNSYAIATVKKQLKRRGGFEKVYADFAAGNAFPAKSYKEGRSWPSPALAGNAVLSKAKSARSVKGTVQVAHLASAHVRVRPDKSLGSKRWRLKVKIDAPARATSPVAVVTVQSKGGKLTTKTVRLNRKGNGKVKVPFSRKKVRSVTVTAVNASTRFGGCYSQDSVIPQYSCSGVARDDASLFALKLSATK